MPRSILISGVVAATVLLSACGQVGPLYMPRVPADPDAPVVVKPPLEMSTPAPASNMSNIPAANGDTHSFGH